MAKKKASKTRKSSPILPAEIDFETALEEVETIVRELESGQLGLGESLQQYELGVKRLKQCHQMLDAAEQKVTVLSGFDVDGNPITEPLSKPNAVIDNDDAPNGEDDF